MNLTKDSFKDRKKVSDGFNSTELVTHHNERPAHLLDDFGYYEAHK